MGGTTIRADLDGMTAIYDRRAGVTHMLSEPAVMILDALTAGEGGLDDISVRVDLAGDGLTALLIERLDELVAVGLVERRDEVVATGLVERH